jgi:hypothetical protein
MTISGGKMKSTNIILPDALGDWRIEAVMRVRGDQVLPSGQLAKDGTLGWKTTLTDDQLYGQVGFPTPQPIALVLHIALTAALNARIARKNITYPRISDSGTRCAEAVQAPLLYEYFEQCMITAVFAFQSIELFANHNIWNKVKAPLTIQRKNKKSKLTPDQLERSLSTDDKISQVLPQLFQTSIDATSDLWTRYTSLKKMRDSIVHLKSKDHYIRGKIDEDSIYYKCLNVDPIELPWTSVSLMRFFVKHGEQRWLDASEDYLKAVATS